MNIKDKARDSYTDDEINELAEWLEELTLREVFFLKESYQGFIKQEVENQMVVPEGTVRH